jgi:hypothetical protein
MPYDQSLERRDVAIRSMYRMWHNKLRKDLLALGLSEADGAKAFQDQPYPKTERLIFDIIQRCPAVVPIAEKLLAQYISNEWEDRKAHYQTKEKTHA